MLDFGVEKAETVSCYWDRDRVLELLSEVTLEAYSIDQEEPLNRKEPLLERAKSITTLMRDPWKKARAICRIAGTHIGEKRFEQAAKEMNYIHSSLLDRIDYRKIQRGCRSEQVDVTRITHSHVPYIIPGTPSDEGREEKRGSSWIKLGDKYVCRPGYDR